MGGTWQRTEWVILGVGGLMLAVGDLRMLGATGRGASVFGGRRFEAAPVPVYPVETDRRRGYGGIMPIPAMATGRSGGALGRGLDWLAESRAGAAAATVNDAGQTKGERSVTSVAGNWMSTARNELGVREVGDTNRGARVDEYHGATDNQLGEPWCSSFVNWTMEQSGISGTDSAASQSWRTWGVDAGGPVRGAIVVFHWGDGKGHVGFVESVNANGTINVLGGNQQHGVNVSTFGTGKVVGYRLPAGYEGGGLVAIGGSGSGTGTLGDAASTR